MPLKGLHKKPDPAAARQLEMIPVIIRNAVINKDGMIWPVFGRAPQQILLQTTPGNRAAPVAGFRNRQPGTNRTR
ncbi:hypothetical protein MSSD14B_32480 [Marinobacter salsuginis]|uniref:Uncharacterized protein n=1 Tax=Marinobacter salsuginis TaxID=418719 RepID=A0A5M3Q4I4_9GAMM|nr:hypothetical protein MSSD14B_32480 [Marinobacter salsuginis]